MNKHHHGLCFLLRKVIKTAKYSTAIKSCRVQDRNSASLNFERSFWKFYKIRLKAIVLLEAANLTILNLLKWNCFVQIDITQLSPTTYQQRVHVKQIINSLDPDQLFKTQLLVPFLTSGLNWLSNKLVCSSLPLMPAYQIQFLVWSKISNWSNDKQLALICSL